MGRRQFAKKGTEVRHFKLVSRASDDAGGEDATPLVLEPFVKPGEQRRTGLTHDELMQVPESLHVLGPDIFGLGDRIDDDECPVRAEGDEEEDLDGDCYFPKDGYNYEKHLRSVSGRGKAGGVVGVVLPAPRPADAPKEEPVIVIGKLAAEVDDQVARSAEEAELLRALEFDDEYEELEDDEVEDLLPSGIAEDPDVILFGPTALEHRDLPDLQAFKNAYKAGQAAGGDDTADGAAGDMPEIDDEDFEAFMAGEYGKEEIGGCEDEDIEGHNELDEEVLDDYIQGKKNEAEQLSSINEPLCPINKKYDNVPRVIAETRAIIERHYTEGIETNTEGDDAETNPGSVFEDTVDESNGWDCESVLSTLSNVSNRPGKIGRIKVAVPKKPKEMAKVEEEGEEESSDEEVIELPDVITERKKGETPEEKKARKDSVKEMRRVCRKMKKESKDMYKTEAARLTGVGTGDIKQNQRYQKL